MKQKIYSLGLIATLLILAGSIFKIQHWPGAGILITIGIATIVLVFLPLALINSYKSLKKEGYKLLYIITWITCFVIFTAMLFKIQHWPFAGTALFIALPFPYLVFLPVFLYVTGKDSSFNIYNTIYVLFLLVVNSVFSALLSMNISAQRISDSIDVASHYSMVEEKLSHFQENRQSPVNAKIDNVLRIIDDYRSIILTGGKITTEQWKSNPTLLQYPDSKQTTLVTLAEAGEFPYGNKLEIALNDLEATLKSTPGYELLVSAMPDIVNPYPEDRLKPLDVTLNITRTYLGWGLIHLDQLETNLKIIKATI
jgi:hypothetical protein